MFVFNASSFGFLIVFVFYSLVMIMIMSRVFLPLELALVLDDYVTVLARLYLQMFNLGFRLRYFYFFILFSFIIEV